MSSRAINGRSIGSIIKRENQSTSITTLLTAFVTIIQSEINIRLIMFSIKTFCIFEKKVVMVKEAMLFVKKYEYLFDLVKMDTDLRSMSWSEMTFLKLEIDERKLSTQVLVEMFEEIKKLKESNVKTELIITSK